MIFKSLLGLFVASLANHILELFKLGFGGLGIGLQTFRVLELLRSSSAPLAEHCLRLRLPSHVFRHFACTCKVVMFLFVI